MNICFEVPCNVPRDVEYMMDVAKSTPGFFWTIGLNGQMEGVGLTATNNLVIASLPNKVRTPCVSMVELRRLTYELSTYHTKPIDFHIQADGNFSYRRDWQLYVRETCEELDRVIQRTGHLAFCNMWGPFGGVATGRQMMVAASAFFETARGLVYPHALLDQIKLHPYPGAGEEMLTTHTAMLNLGAIPFKRFYSPIHHPLDKSRFGREPRTFQREDVIDRGCWTAMRKLWNDPHWTLPVHRSQTGWNADRSRYYAMAPRAADKFLRKLRRDCVEHFGLRHLVRLNKTETATYGDEP